VSTVLEAELLVHLDQQINSARQLLRLVLAQGAAIRERDTEAVLARLADIQSEMVRRGALEQERTSLLQRAGVALGMPGTNVTLERLCSLITPGAASAAMERSAELRGLLAEIAREHTVNRALMRQELAFLDHLTRLLSGAADLGYRPPAERAGANLRVVEDPQSTHRVLNVEA
jgi:flagellar biosynthesis/type III secretory pathway chaperone